jgi:nicotinamide-nucleotide amidase
MNPQAQYIVDTLTNRGEKIAVAESLTGGMLSAALTDVPGTSHIFLGSVIAYSVEIKIRELAVKQATIDRCGVVSEEVAFEMAEGIRSKFGSTWAISTTGVAGPGPSHSIPAGTVWIAIIGPSHREALALALEGDRAAVRLGAVESALATLARILRG